MECVVINKYNKINLVKPTWKFFFSESPTGIRGVLGSVPVRDSEKKLFLPSRIYVIIFIKAIPIENLSYFCFYIYN